jgi:hypothetical protein
MKKLIIIPLLFFTLLTSGQYYVAPWGSNSNPGTFAEPWATLQQGIEEAVAGDTVWIRGGTYYPTTKATGGTGVFVIYPTTGHGASGTWDAPICYFAYPGERPVFDCVNAANADYGNIGLVIQEATNLKFKGLTFKNNPMKNSTDNSGGVSFAGLNEGGNVYFEDCEFSYNGGPGLWIRGYDTAYVVNCDSHHNLDSLDASYGGGGDGFTLSSRGAAADTFKLTVVTGCRSYNNSDDGFDIGSTKQLQFYNNWSWNNGFIGAGEVDGGGDGVGLKVSYSHLALTSKRRIYNNIFAYNIAMSEDAGAGIAEVNLYDEGVYGPLAEIYNNFFYNNYSGISSSLSWGWANYPSKFYKDVISNNAVLGWSSDYPATFKAVNYSQGDPSYVTLRTNTFYLLSAYGNCITNPAYTITADDFVSLDTAQLRGARLADGSLPYITFGRLEDASDLKGAGTNVGMSTTPDIGVDWAYLDGEYDETATNILSYTFANIVGRAVINATTHTVTAVLAAGQDISAVTPTFTLSPGATSDPASGVEDDFTNPVTVTVTAEDEVTEQEWTVTITLDDDPVPTVATIGTLSASYNSYKALVTGRIYSANGGTLTQRGICWSTSNSSPTITDRRTIYTPYVGSFTDVISGLKGNTTYYFRAYGVTSEGGASYGDAITITTPAQTPVTNGGLPPIANNKPVIIK